MTSKKKVVKAKKKSVTKKKPVKKKKVLTDDDFEKKYTYDGSVKSKQFDTDGSQDGMFETYGPDFEHVKKVFNETPKRVWTAYEGEKGLWFIAGLHYVNRLYYVITVEEYEDKSEEYLVK